MTLNGKSPDRMHFNTVFLPEHFRAPPPESQAELFRTAVRSVEIEVSSFCNRSCWFCPNATHSRRERNFMSDDVYSWVIGALAGISYDGVISYSGYTEAAHDRSFLDRIRFARERLPHSHIFTCSNGDYLTPEYLEELADAGMDHMFISCYVDDRREGSFSLPRALTAIGRLQRRLGLALDYKISDGSSVCAEATNKRTRLTVSCRDHSVYANDRGGTVKVKQPGRHEPCSWVFSNVYIDYDGTMKPCANVRADIPSHAQFMYGSIRSPSSLFELYWSDKATSWRRDLVAFGQKSGPCAHCIQGVVSDTEENRGLAATIVRDWITE